MNENKTYYKIKDIMYEMYELHTKKDYNEMKCNKLESELQELLSDKANLKFYEQWKLTIGFDDKPEKVISEDIQKVNKQLIDLIAKIQNSEPAPHRELGNGFYERAEANKMIFMDYHIYEIKTLIDLCKKAYDIQKQVTDPQLKLIPIISIDLLKEKYPLSCEWGNLKGFIGVLSKM